MTSIDEGVDMPVTYQSFVPYPFYDDPAAAVAWYSKMFGFTEIGRWANDDGKVMNEMRAGDSEFWLDGGGKPATQSQRRTWIGIWVDDVDAVFRQDQAPGLEVDPSVDREFGVRRLDVPDPMSYEWGFMKRICPR